MVKEEVKGGEACAVPAPRASSGCPTDPAKIKDEPLVVDVPKGLSPLTAQRLVPASNPITKGKFELGQAALLRPARLQGRHGQLRHLPQPREGVDRQHQDVSIGIDGQIGGRNAPTVLNTAYGKTMFWDGRSPSLEGQAQGPIQNKIEMGDQSYKEIIDATPRDLGLPGAVREGLRHRRDPRRDGQGDRHLRAGGGPLGQLDVRQVRLGTAT